MKLFDKNFTLTGGNEDPCIVKYNLAELYEKITINNAGEVVLREYFTTYDSLTDTYSGLAFDEAVAFTRSLITGWIVSQETTITWYFEDNTVGCSEVNQRIFTLEEAYREGKTRRNNIADRCTIMVLAALGEPTGIAFLNTAGAQINLYILGDTAPLIALVTASAFPALLKADVLTMLNLA